MNLISNALKFISNGGNINIICNLVQKEEDSNHTDLVEFQDLIRNSKNGMIEIEIKDTGIGIKPEDQTKLFKLFGFLDTTKELNTKGIGLGLHICKLIAH